MIPATGLNRVCRDYKEMDTQQIDVMVADASHEVYVDTILETIGNAAAVRGTGIAERISVLTRMTLPRM